MINFLISFYFSANILFPVVTSPYKPGIGKEFEIIFQIKRISPGFSYSEIEVGPGTNIFLKNYELNLCFSKKIRKYLILQFSPGFVYAVKEKNEFKESGYFSSLNFFLRIPNQISPSIGLKSFFDDKTFITFFKLGLFLVF